MDHPRESIIDDRNTIRVKRIKAGMLFGLFITSSLS